MENDVFKNKIAPWQEKGRWYHIKLDSNGIIQSETDTFIKNNFFLDASGAFWRIGQTSSSYNIKPHRILNIIIRESDDYAISSNTTINVSDYIYATGRNFKYLSAIPATGTIDVWLFIV